MDVKCPGECIHCFASQIGSGSPFVPQGCFAITTVFSHAQTVVLCGACSSVLCQPTGGKARLTEGTPSFACSQGIFTQTYTVYRELIPPEELMVLQYLLSLPCYHQHFALLVTHLSPSRIRHDAAWIYYLQGTLATLAFTLLV